MSRRNLIIAAIALVAVAAWWWARPGRAPAAPAAATPAAAVTSPAVAAAPALVATAAPTVAAPDEPDDPGPVLDSTHAALHARARGCWDRRAPRASRPGEPDDTVGRLELKLQVIVEGGRARTAAVEIVSTRRLRDDLRACIEAEARAAVWDVATPDTVMTITELFRMGDYTVPAVTRPDFVPTPPPSEAPGP